MGSSEKVKLGRVTSIFEDNTAPVRTHVVPPAPAIDQFWCNYEMAIIQVQGFTADNHVQILGYSRNGTRQSESIPRSSLSSSGGWTYLEPDKGQEIWDQFENKRKARKPRHP